MLDENRTSGVDFSKCTLEDKYYNERLLYYGEGGKLTDKYFIKYPVLIKDGKICNTGTHPMFLHNFNTTAVGDYVTTCEVKGACFKCTNKELAFGVVEKIYYDKFDPLGGNLVGRADVTFL